MVAQNIQPRHFDAAYAERVTLADGSHATLRMIRPSDKPQIVDGLGRMSETSRYRRFLSAKRSLSESELRYLTEIDGENHVAIVALEADGGETRRIGVARFVRLSEEPTSAEAAVTVTDENQGKGLGRVLLQRLVAAAVELRAAGRGVLAVRRALQLGDDEVDR